VLKQKNGQSVLAELFNVLDVGHALHIFAILPCSQVGHIFLKCGEWCFKTSPPS